MTTPQLSPGIITREVDLTIGRSDNVTDNIGGIAGPFAIGPVAESTDITNEQELIDIFGKPSSTDNQYEYWMSAASYLSYGGVLKVVRADDDDLKNARVGYNTDATLKIKNFDDYNSQTTGNYHYAAKTPGTWANDLRICVIDDFADQTIGFSTSDLGNAGVVVGNGVTTGISATIIGSGSTSTFDGYLKGIITGVTTDTSNSNSTFDVKIVSRVSTAGTETKIAYSDNVRYASFSASDSLTLMNNSGVSTGNIGAITASSAVDWYDQQTLSGLDNSTIFWKTIAPKPVTNQYTTDRNGYNDGIHVVVIDDKGSISGIQGTILEKHISLSKAEDSISLVNSPQKNYYRNYLANFSKYVYAGTNYYTVADTTNSIVPVATGFTAYTGVAAASFTPITLSNGGWNRDAQGSTFNAIGNQTFTLATGADYSSGSEGSSGSLTATLGNLSSAYDLLSNSDEVDLDFLIYGPGLGTLEESQAKANKLISIANDRKDCLAVISPYREAIVDITNTTTQTDNILNFFAPLSSSSYAVFDSGYKYTYDRFNNLFRYVPTNADVAGLMARTSINSFPWFSPAGQQRGILNNAIKLTYNPNKAQRDQLYKSRINSIVSQSGVGIVLFGDKTALSYASAFDRINVRRLFLTVEQSLERSAQSQLFELNDQVTRANFINVVEPYLRDVQAKRGIYDFVVVCDESNNTPQVVDNNEFRADIFLKPTKSINYVTLSFVATRTGVSFSEVVGSV